MGIEHVYVCGLEPGGRLPSLSGLGEGPLDWRLAGSNPALQLGR